MAIWRGAGGSGDATTDAANEASVASNKAAEAAASATAAASSATSAATEATTATTQASAASTSATNAASSASAASTSETNAATSATNASTSASNAATSATNAATEATNAANSASAAAASETAASSSETNAATSETNAASSASAASSSETAAASSATAAASSASSASTSASNALTSETNAGTSETNAATSATNAANSATASASSASAASTSASNASTSETNAATSASNAATSASNASTSETNAASSATSSATSATNAATSETNAAASYDSFDDRYLGAKSSAPSVDNDGDALLTGALYWNTGSNQLFVWSGSVWEQAAFSISGSVTSFNTRTGAVTLSAADVNTALGSDAVLDSDIGSTVQAYSSVLQNTTASYTTAEETKLAGIEALADVTDTTNVTAAGALMDSELTSEASVKALNQGVATTDSPSFAGLTVASNSTYAIDVSRVGAGNTTLRITGGSTAGNDAVLRADIGNTTGTSAVYFGDSTTNGIGRIMYEHNGDYMRFYTSSIETMRIDSSGNVLIGATATASTSYGAKFLKDSTASEILAIHRQANDGDFIQFARGASASGNIKHSSGNLVINAVNDFQIETNDGTNAVHIDTTGNVGIGTSSPANKLEVIGAIVAQGAVTAYTNTGLYLQNKGSSVFDVGAWRSGASVAELTFSTDSGSDAAPVERMRIDSSGNVGIGTSNPAAQLDVVGTVRLTNTANASNNSNIRDGGGLVVEAGNNNPLYFYTGGSEKVRITSAGNVGIGTNTPSATLHVDSQNTTTPSLTFGATSGQIFQNEDSELAIGLSGSSPYPLYIQGRTNLNAARQIVINPLGGNVGIGTSSPNNKLTIEGSVTLNPSYATYLANSYYDSAWKYAGNGVAWGIGNNFGGSSNGTTIAVATSNSGGAGASLTWNPAFNITSTGNVGIGTTAPTRTLTVQNSINVMEIALTSSSSSQESAMVFVKNGSEVGYINCTTSSTHYGTSSDYRLKEDLQPMSGSVDRVKALNPVNFAWKVDGLRVDGFLAHEVQDIVPEAISGTKDAVDDKGNPVYQGIDQSKLVPLLTAALQEAITKIETLEARVTALES